METDTPTQDQVIMDAGPAAIQDMNPTMLLGWVQGRLRVPLSEINAQKFLSAEITGNAFLYAAGIFEKAGISMGPSFDLAQLAKAVIDSEISTSKFYLINTTQTASR
ncbi:hypothetical protein V8E54_006464 [Elaphomyces granulatus]